MFQIQVGRGISKQGPHIIAMPPLELRGEFLVFLFPRPSFDPEEYIIFYIYAEFRMIVSKNI